MGTEKKPVQSLKDLDPLSRVKAHLVGLYRDGVKGFRDSRCPGLVRMVEEVVIQSPVGSVFEVTLKKGDYLCLVHFLGPDSGIGRSCSILNGGRKEGVTYDCDTGNRANKEKYLESKMREYPQIL